MQNSPWAKLMRRTTPNMRASPVATMAYMDPRVSPWIACSRRSSIGGRQPSATCRRLQNRGGTGLKASRFGRQKGGGLWPPPCLAAVAREDLLRGGREPLDDPELAP